MDHSVPFTVEPRQLSSDIQVPSSASTLIFARRFGCCHLLPPLLCQMAMTVGLLRPFRGKGNKPVRSRKLARARFHTYSRRAVP